MMKIKMTMTMMMIIIGSSIPIIIGSIGIIIVMMMI